MHLFPAKRIATLWINYAIAVLIYTAFNLLVGVKFSTRFFIESLFAWDKVASFHGIGHPTWYIFCILACYTFSMASFWISKKGQLWILIGFVSLYSVCMMIFKTEYWCDTVFCYCFGTACSLYRDQIDAILRKDALTVLLASTILFFALFKLDGLPWVVRMNVQGVVMMICFMAYFSRCTFGNLVLVWLGKKVFPIYMYHMLFVFILSRLWVGNVTPVMAHVSLIGILLCTIIFAFLYTYISFSSSTIQFLVRKIR